MYWETLGSAQKARQKIILVKVRFKAFCSYRRLCLCLWNVCLGTLLDEGLIKFE